MSGTTETETEPSASTPTYEFDGETQSEIAASLMNDADFCRRTESLIKPSYFVDDIEGILAGMAMDYHKKYKDVPPTHVWLELLKEAKTSKRIRSDQWDDLKEKFVDLKKRTVRARAWLMDNVAKWAQEQAITESIIRSAKLVGDSRDETRFQKIKEMVVKAVELGLADRDESYNYFDRIEERTNTRLEIAAGGKMKSGVTTGVPELDKHLFHNGWGKRELSLLMGGAKASKSFALGFFAAQAAKAGHNVLFVTLENSRDIVAGRLDAFFSGVGISEHLTSPHAVDLGVRGAAGRPGIGRVEIREFPTGTFKPSKLKAIMDQDRGRGIVYELVVIDYADIMAPDYRTDDKIENSASVYRTIRAIGQEENVAILTATQTNREGHKSAVARSEHVAEDFNKIRLCDVCVSINRTDDERADGKARFYIVAARNTPDGITFFVKQDLDKGLAIAEVESVE